MVAQSTGIPDIGVNSLPANHILLNDDLNGSWLGVPIGPSHILTAAQPEYVVSCATLTFSFGKRFALAILLLV